MVHRVKKRLVTTLLLASIVMPCSARAQPDRDPVRSEADFTAGKALLEAGKISEACEKLASSERLDPGVGTLGLLAICHEKQGRLATAWREYTETARRAAAARDSRDAFASEQARRLEARLPRLVIHVSRPPAGLTVKSDDEPFDARDLSDGRLVDPGTHVIVAAAPGYRDFTRTIALVGGERTVVEVGELSPEAPPRDLGARTPPPGGASTAPWVLGGICAATLVAGGVLGLVVIGEKSTADAHCDRRTRTCDAAGVAANDAGRTLGPLTTAAFVVGGLGVGASAVWLVLYDRPGTTAIVMLSVGGTASASGGSWRLEGRW
jgi:hypothetical protein